MPQTPQYTTGSQARKEASFAFFERLCVSTAGERSNPAGLLGLPAWPLHRA